MPVKNEIEDDSESKTFYRSYFALIPIFKNRKKGIAERNVIRLIHKSNIFNSNPVLKTLLIENVRITCIVVESSGKQSVKILCASVPYLLTLISKTNHKFENFLKNENISSCLKFFSESDFEYVLNSAYDMTIFLHNGFKKLYPIIYVNFIKDSIPNSEKFLLYLGKLILHLLQSAVEFLSDNITFYFHYFRQQNYRFFTYVVDNFPFLIASFIKYAVIATENVYKAVFLCVQYVKNSVRAFIHFLKDYQESTLCYSLKKLYLFLKLSLSYLRAADIFNRTERACLHLFNTIKPYLWKYCIKLVDALKCLIQIAIPYAKDIANTIVKDSIPFLRKFIEDNYGIILNLYSDMKSFLLENMDNIKPFCCRTCRILYDSIRYMYNILQTVLPHVIQFSSNAVVFSIAFSKNILERCAYFCKILYYYIVTAIESQRKNFCRLSKNAMNILKRICEIVLKAQPYMVLFIRTVINELSKVIHELSPTLIPCIREINSSLFCASKEVVGKSYLAMKRVTPSFYYSMKKVVPPTLTAIHELLKSSKNCVVIISPAVLKFALRIHPELKEGFIILISDGNKACIEIITVSYFASREIKNAAITVSSNIPVVYKAVNEVLFTTAYATIEVTNKSLNAKSRMLKDIKSACRVVQTSFVLAEEEVVTVYNDFMCEIDTFFPKPKEPEVSKNSFLRKYFDCISNNFIKIIKIATSELIGLTQNSVIYIQKISKLLLSVIFYILFLAYAAFTNFIKLGITKMTTVNKDRFMPFLHILRKNGCIISSKLCNLSNHAFNCISNSNIRIIQCMLAYISKTWHAVKYNVNAMWNRICLFAPELWILIEHFASELWSFITEYTPCLWNSWKRFCSALWKLTEDLTPHVWRYSSTTVSVLWPTGRTVTKELWHLFTCTSSFTWKQTASFSSEYWLLSETYVPLLWFSGCKELKTTWIATCYSIENCYNFTIQSCSLSWNFLQSTVATTWRSCVVFTKTAYCMVTTTGSVLQRSFCACSKTKKYVHIILKRTPLSDLSFNSFRIPKFKIISRN